MASLIALSLLLVSCAQAATQEEGETGSPAEEEVSKGEQQKVIRYFAYGSNMNKEDLDKWCENRGFSLVKFLSVSPAKLDDYRLCFNYFPASRNGGAANIMGSDEGHPNFYKEISVDVQRLDGMVVQDVITYKVVECREEPGHQPSTRNYLSLIIRSAIRYGFPSDYVNYLQSLKTID